MFTTKILQADHRMTHRSMSLTHYILHASDANTSHHRASSPLSHMSSMYHYMTSSIHWHISLLYWNALLFDVIFAPGWQQLLEKCTVPRPPM